MIPNRLQALPWKKIRVFSGKIPGFKFKEKERRKRTKYILSISVSGTEIVGSVIFLICTAGFFAILTNVA
jgi:hypothetical protein